MRRVLDRVHSPIALQPFVASKISISVEDLFRLRWRLHEITVMHPMGCIELHPL